MPSIHYLPTGIRKALPDGTSEELYFVLVVDEEMHMTVTVRFYKLSSITGSPQAPTHSTRFPPNEDFVSSPMATAILTGEFTVLVGRRFMNPDKEGEEEFAIPWRWFEQAGRPRPEMKQVVEEGERAFDAERDALNMDDYPEEYVEESPRGPPPSPTVTTTHPFTPPHSRWLSGPSLPPCAPPRYVSRFFPQPDIRSLTIAERRIRTRLAGEPVAGQTVRFPPERIDVALAEESGRDTMPGLRS